MKNLSKLLSVLLCLAMVLGIFTMTGIAAPEDVKTATLVSSEAERGNGVEMGTLNLGGTENPTAVTVTGAAGTANNAPKYYTSGSAFRCYNGNTLTFTPGANWRLLTITINTLNNYPVEATPTLSNASATVTATSTELRVIDGTQTVVLTHKSSTQLRISSITVTYQDRSIPVATIDVTGVTITPATVSTTIGESLALVAAVAPDNASNPNVTWASSDPTVATVDDQGNIFALKAGTTNITATSANNKVGTCVVTVGAAPIANKITSSTTFISGDQIVLVEETTSQIMGPKQDGKYRYLSKPAAVSDGTVAVSSIATVLTLEAGSIDGTFKLKLGDQYFYHKVGESELRLGVPGTEGAPELKYFDWNITDNGIFATNLDAEGDTEYRQICWNNYGYFSAYIVGNASYYETGHVYKVVQPVTGVTLDKTSQNMTVGNTMDLVATVAPGNATNKSVTWTSSKTDVATVDQTGKVTAVAPGTATITVTTEDGGKTATCEITVVAATVPATGVTLDKTSETLNVGGEVNLTATVAPADTTDTLTWTTSNADVATVAGGKVTAVGVGTATITATAGDKSATCTITVAVAVSKVELDKATANMTVGGETTLTATVTVNPNADTYKNVTWTTSDATVATVENGKVKALKAGTVTITATSATDNTKKAECAITITEPVVSTNEGKITSLDQLVTGTYVLVVDSGYAAGALDGTWVSAVQPTIADDKVTDAKGGIWTLTVTGNQVTIKDANGKFIAPKGGNNNGIKEGEYSWTVTFEDGKFIFAGADADTVYLASNIESENKFRGYKVSTLTGDYADGYPCEFTVYAVTSSTGSGSTGNENTGSGSTGNENTGNENTGSGSTGNENTGSGSTDTGNKDESAKTELTKQDAPTAGKSFKLGLYQDNLKKNLYFAGATTDKDYYLATTEDPKEAVDVTVEAVEGGYRMYFTKDGVKTYLDVHKSGNYVNLRLTDEPTAVWTWNEEYKTFVADVEGETYYCGTYDKYSSLSASKLSYAATSFTSGLYLDQPSSTGDTFEPMVIILALAAVSALAVLALNKKKFIF